MKKKILTTLALIVCAVLLVVGSVAGTIAYLTSQATVNNTFTVGDVKITMDEANAAGEGRVASNEYKLIPGKTYENDLTIYVDADSEDCYIFVKLPANTNITYNLATDWTLLEGDVYYYNTKVSTNDEVAEVDVVTSFKVANDATAATLANVTTQISFVGYAVQSEGFTSAADAWAASGFGN